MSYLEFSFIAAVNSFIFMLRIFLRSTFSLPSYKIYYILMLMTGLCL